VALDAGSPVAQGTNQLGALHRGSAVHFEFRGPLAELRDGPVVLGARFAALLAHLTP